MRSPVVFFDLDGTLLDTLADLRDSLNRVLTQNGLPPRTTEEVRQFVGNGLTNLVARAVAGGNAHPQFEKIVEQLRADYALHCNDQTAPYPHIVESLSELQADGWQIGVVSNKPDAQVKALCRTFFGDTISAAIGQSEGVRIKPAPDTLFAAMHQLGAEAADCVYVGDSEVDIRTANNAAIPCISVSWGFRDRSALMENGAKMLADTPNAMLSLLRELFSEKTIL